MPLIFSYKAFTSTLRNTDAIASIVIGKLQYPAYIFARASLVISIPSRWHSSPDLTLDQTRFTWPMFPFIKFNWYLESSVNAFAERIYVSDLCSTSCFVSVIVLCGHRDHEVQAEGCTFHLESTCAPLTND